MRQICTGLLMCTIRSVNVAPCPGQHWHRCYSSWY